MSRIETSTRYVGWCPVCERDIKVRGNALVHHGYQRPGIGYIVGDCPGVGHEPYELGTGAAEYYLKIVLDKIHLTTSYLDRLRRPNSPVRLSFEDYDVETKRVRRERGKFGPPEIVQLTRAEAEARAEKLPPWDRGRYDWDRALRSEIAGQEAQLRYWTQEQQRIERLIAEWRPQPLRTIEEEIRRQEQSRDEREAARTIARDQKIQAEVVKIRKRIDSAVKNRNSAVLADIFRSDKIRAVSGWRLSQEHALALLERDDVWRAFGLIGHEGYLLDESARDILDEMTWGQRVPTTRPGVRFDYAPMPWPAELGGGVAKTRGV